MAKKRSFFERLTGAVSVDEYENDLAPSEPENEKSWIEEENSEGQLTVDVYQTNSEIVVKTMVAGVRPEDLDIAITRDMVTIKGKREAERTISTEDYFHKELYWGTFSRTILLPAEVDVEEAEATEKHGLLTIKLPKVNKDKQAKLRVKTNS
ncbi:MAG: hypothetical protein RJA61_321 [Candidatus Parcubacteria bacterium]|jgi:HSP20 family protein